MDNDALVAALGSDAVAAVHGYRSEVISEAANRGLRLVAGSFSDVEQSSEEDGHIIDPIDVRLTFRCGHGSGRADLDGRALQWNPAHGWSSRYAPGQPVVRYYAGPRARPADLVPAASDVLDWAIADLHGSGFRDSAPPEDVDLDDDPRTLRRLLDFIDPTGGQHVALTT